MISLASCIRKIGINIFQKDEYVDNITKDKAFEKVKDIYEGFNVETESIPEGVAYFVRWKNERYQVANYDFKRNRLFYRIPKRYVFKKL